MFENYVHPKEDLEAVEEALEYLERSELDFIFKDRNLIKNTLVISFDSKELFIWTKLETSKLEKISCRVKGWNAYRTAHRLKLTDKEQVGWSAGIKIEKITKYLPAEFNRNDFEIPKINGSLLTPFVGIHKKQREIKFRPNDPYYTRESYIATIIHEFGHIYFGKIIPRYYSDKEETIGYMKMALDLYEDGDKTSIESVNLRFLSAKGISEVFAFCTDYCAASVFWLSHKENIDVENKEKIKNAIVNEEKLNLQVEDTSLADPHFLASVFGKIIFDKYPKDWPIKLLEIGKINL